MSRLDYDGANLTDSNISMCSYNSYNNNNYHLINIRLQTHTPTRSPIPMKTYKQYIFFDLFIFIARKDTRTFISSCT